MAALILSATDTGQWSSQFNINKFNKVGPLKLHGGEKNTLSRVQISNLSLSCRCQPLGDPPLMFSMRWNAMNNHRYITGAIQSYKKWATNPHPHPHYPHHPHHPQPSPAKHRGDPIGRCWPRWRCSPRHWAEHPPGADPWAMPAIRSPSAGGRPSPPPRETEKLRKETVGRKKHRAIVNGNDFNSKIVGDCQDIWMYCEVGPRTFGDLGRTSRLLTCFCVWFKGVFTFIGVFTDFSNIEWQNIH